MHWRRKWQPTPVFLPAESPGRGSLVGCRLWGHTELVMTVSRRVFLCVGQDKWLSSCFAWTGGWRQTKNTCGGKKGKKKKRCIGVRISERESEKVKVLVTQTCSTLCNPMDCSPAGFSVHESLGKNTDVGCHFLLLGLGLGLGSSQLRD